MTQTITKNNYPWIAGLAVVALLVFSYIFNEKPDLNGDNCYYYANATSLAHGDGYSDMFGNPTTNFPPGYPLLMTPLRLLTSSIVAQKVLNLIFLFVAVVLLFDILVRNGYKRSLAFATGVTVLVTPHILEFSTMMMSEASCICCLALIAWLYVRLPDDEAAFWRTPCFYLLLLSLVFVYYIRTQALAVVGAVVVAFLFERRLRASLATVVAFVIGMLPWIVRNEVLGLNQSRYVSQIDFSNIAANIKMLIVQAIPESIFPFVNVSYNDTPGAFLWAFAVIWFLLIIYGFWRMGRLRWPLIIYLLGTIAIISIINTPSRYRYMTTALPFLTAGLFVGIYSLAERYAKHKKTELLPWTLLGLLCIALLVQKGDDTKHTIWGLNKQAKMEYPANFRNYFILGKQLYRYDKNAIVATRKPELLYVNSGIRGKHFLETNDQAKLVEDLIKKNIDFVVLEQLGFLATYRYLLPCVEQNPEFFKPVANIPNPDTYLIYFDRKKAQEWLDRRK
ncbi:MAG: hypothetical protein IJA04_01040 [Bacteroidaceae bacterium]|nr:hypothetical protein [Bacteroidaceae bacterium]